MVSRFASVTQTDFNALAALANSKAIPGKPFNFNAPQNPFTSDPPTIWTELLRLRVALYSKFQWFGQNTGAFDSLLYFSAYPGKPSMLVSGPWPINAGRFGASFLKTFAIDTEDIYDDFRYIGFVPTVAENKYVFIRTAGSVETTMNFGQGNRMWQPRLYVKTGDGSGPPYYSAQTFRVTARLDGHPFTLNFSLPFVARANAAGPATADLIEKFGANAADFTLTITAIVPVGGGENNIFGTLTRNEVMTEDFEFEVGIRDSTQGTSQRIRFIDYTPSAASFTATLTNQTSTTNHFPVIDNQDVGSVIVPPSMANLKVYHTDADADETWINGTLKHFGNQAVITMTPTNPNEGCWIAKTHPIGGLYFYQSTSLATGMNPAARAPSQGEIDDVFLRNAPNACGLMLPSYPIERWTGSESLNGNLLDVSGAVIRDLFIRRKPVDSGDGILYVPPENRPALTVHIGQVFASGAFRAFDTFTIPQGQLDIHVPVFYLATTLVNDPHFRLFYVATEELDVQASYSTPIISGTFDGEDPTLAQPGTVVGFSGPTHEESGVGLLFRTPYLASHFNDTEALLNLLT